MAGQRAPESHRRSRLAITLVEILIGVAIVGLALAPVIGIVNKSFSQIRAEKAEATAVNYAGKLMNEILFQKGFREVVNKGDSWQGTEEVDGTTIHYVFDVRKYAYDDLKFRFKKLQYHAPHLTGAEQAGVTYVPAPPATAPPAVDIWNEPVTRIDRKFVDASIGTVMLEIMLTVEWKPKDEATFKREHKQMLYTRKARLE